MWQDLETLLQQMGELCFSWQSSVAPPVCPQITKEELFIALGSPDQTSRSVTTKPSFGKRQMLALLKLLHPECFILMYFEKKVTYKEKAGRRGILHRILPKKWEQAGSRFFLTKQVRVHTKRDFHAACFFWQTDETVGRDQWNWVPLNQLCPDTTLCLTSFNFTYLLGLFILIVSLSKAKSMSWALPDT